MSEIPVPEPQLYFLRLGAVTTEGGSVCELLSRVAAGADWALCCLVGHSPAAHTSSSSCRSQLLVGGGKTPPQVAVARQVVALVGCTSVAFPRGFTGGFLSHPPAPGPAWPRGSVSSLGPGLDGAAPSDPLFSHRPSPTGPARDPEALSPAGPSLFIHMWLVLAGCLLGASWGERPGPCLLLHCSRGQTACTQ